MTRSRDRGKNYVQVGNLYGVRKGTLRQWVRPTYPLEIHHMEGRLGEFKTEYSTPNEVRSPQIVLCSNSALWVLSAVMSALSHLVFYFFILENTIFRHSIITMGNYSGAVCGQFYD